MNSLAEFKLDYPREPRGRIGHPLTGEAARRHMLAKIVLGWHTFNKNNPALILQQTLWLSASPIVGRGYSPRALRTTLYTLILFHDFLLGVAKLVRGSHNCCYSPSFALGSQTIMEKLPHGQFIIHRKR